LSQPDGPTTGEVLWDTWGVPHIYGHDLASLMAGLGWAQAHAHGNVLLRLYGAARGRSAEYWGGGAAALAQDLLLHTFNLPEQARTWYACQEPMFRAGLDAFAEAINAYAAAHPAAIDPAVAVVLPVSAIDVMAHTERVAFEFLLVNAADCNALRPQSAAGEPGPSGAEPLPGSNAWAIGPAHSADGHPLLLINPHLPWSGLYTFFEAHLAAPDYDAYGVALVGLPVLTMAFTDYLGWAHTVNTHDGADAYRLTTDGDGYLLDGVRQAYVRRNVTLRSRADDGSLTEHTFTVRRSVHGPVLTAPDGGSVAVRMVGIDQFPAIGALQEWWDMAAARDLAAFEAVLARLQLPMLTVMYADRDGHILHLFGGQVPKRPMGDWTTWSQPVAGDSSATLWTALHPYADLPRVVDPARGWLQNSNSPPWNTTFPSPLDPADFAPYMAPRGLGLREQRAIHLLRGAGALSAEDLCRLKHDNRCELADRILDDLLHAILESSDATARSAAAVLAAWDRCAGTDSRGMALFFAWVSFAQLHGGISFAEPWDPARPLETPRGLADPGQAVMTLIAAAGQLLHAGVALDVPWGELARVRVGGADVPANGGPGEPFGIFRTVTVVPDADQRLRAVHGDSFVAVVSFAQPVRAQVLLTYGNSSQSGSPHAGDQADHFARGTLRSAWRTRTEILAHLERRDTLPSGLISGTGL
jgi:acyl-homoserine-lactone acylase